MKSTIVLCLCIFATLSLAAERRKRSASITLRANPRVAVEGLTPQLRLDCKPSPSVDNVLLAVLIHIERVDENGTVTLVASKRINALEVNEDNSSVSTDMAYLENLDADAREELLALEQKFTVLLANNRTTADFNLQSSAKDASSFLSAVITDPMMSDEGEYHCRYAYIDDKWQVHSLASKINVTVTDLPPPDYTPNVGCDCDQIWEEIDNLKATLVAENKQLKAQLGGGGGAVVATTGDSCRASFSARFQTRLGYQIIGESPAIFDDVISNQGDAYDASTGVFTVPCAGQYFFSLTLRSHQDLDSGFVDGVIVVDGENRARTSVFINAPVENLQSASNGVVLSLTKGQEVSVLIKSTTTGEFVGEEYSIFSGFYISP